MFDIGEKKLWSMIKKYIDNQLTGAGEVTGVKGNAETNYRAGTVNLTPANIGSYSKSESDTQHNALSEEITTLGYMVGINAKGVYGVSVDYDTATFTRLGDAVGLTAGANFDNVTPFMRKRCIVTNNGTILAYYGDEGYTETGALEQAITIDETTYAVGTPVQVMVYQPKFYYKVIPVQLEKNTDSNIGYHLVKANYYVSGEKKDGFKVHPVFLDKNGNEADYVLLGAFEASMYDVSASAYVNDDTDTATAIETGDLLCSVGANKKPISGLYKNLTKANAELMAQNRGTDWHMETIQASMVDILLYMIEYASLDSQTAIGQGVVSITDNSSYNCASLTGSTVGNGSGNAASTISEIGSTQTTQTANGKVSVAYRGKENDWGNIWKHINGINIWGNGMMAGGQAYVCSDFAFNESKNSGNYKATGITAMTASNYIKYFGYNEEFDWLFIGSKGDTNANSIVKDYHYITSNLNGYRIALLGGSWDYGGYAGALYWGLRSGVGYRYRAVGARLFYIKTQSV